MYKDKWAHTQPMGPKSTLRLMRTLGPSLASLAQSSQSLLFNALRGQDCITLSSKKGYHMYTMNNDFYLGFLLYLYKPFWVLVCGSLQSDYHLGKFPLSKVRWLKPLIFLNHLLTNLFSGRRGLGRYLASFDQIPYGTFLAIRGPNGCCLPWSNTYLVYKPPSLFGLLRRRGICR